MFLPIVQSRAHSHAVVAVVVPHTQHIPAPQRSEELDVLQLLDGRAGEQLPVDLVPVLDQRVQISYGLVVRKAEGRDGITSLGRDGCPRRARGRVRQVADDPFRKGL